MASHTWFQEPEKQQSTAVLLCSVDINFSVAECVFKETAFFNKKKFTPGCREEFYFSYHWGMSTPAHLIMERMEVMENGNNAAAIRV